MKTLGVNKKLEHFDQFIVDFISFHMELSKKEKIQDDVCFVNKDILDVLNIINDGEDPIYAIINIYGVIRWNLEAKKGGKSNE